MRMIDPTRPSWLCVSAAGFIATAHIPVNAVAQMAHPEFLRTRYEAANPKVGGHFIIWLEREKVYHGLDPRLYPAVKYVDVTRITPSPGSPIVTIIEVMPLTSTTPEYYHVAGIVRFRVGGMTVGHLEK